jgi:hypothetical protein
MRDSNQLQKAKSRSATADGLLPLLAFPISLRYIGINFSPNRIHKKNRTACPPRRILFFFFLLAKPTAA